MTALDWSVIFQGVSAVGSMLIAIAAFLYTRKSLRMQTATQYLTHWRELSKLLLESERANAAFARVVGSTDREREDEYAVVLMFVDQALLAYRAQGIGALPESEMEEEFRAVWRIVANKRDLVAEVLDNESHPPDFKSRFKKVGELARGKGKVDA